jgi:hypothetical protein
LAFLLFALIALLDFVVFFTGGLRSGWGRCTSKEGLNKALRGWGSIEIAAAKDSAGLSLSTLV